VDSINERVRQDVDRYGWHVAMIVGDHRAPPWAFTIGLRERFEHAEVIAFGLPPEDLQSLLNRVGQRVSQGQRHLGGARVEGILADLPCAFESVHPRWTSVFADNIGWFYQQSFEATGRPVPADADRLVQCFWPDPEGRFPWDPEFDPELRPLQPLLGLEDDARALSPGLRQALAQDHAF